MSGWIKRGCQVGLIAVLVVYLGAYLTLSRRSMAEARTLDSEGHFFYQSLAELERSQERGDLAEFASREVTLIVFFLPLNFLESLLNPEAGHGAMPLMDLS